MPWPVALSLLTYVSDVVVNSVLRTCQLFVTYLSAVCVVLGF